MAMKMGAHAAARRAAGRFSHLTGASLPQSLLLSTPFFPTPKSAVHLVGHSFSTVKFMDEKRSGEETVYFKKEDELLLRNLLANHPEYDPKYTWNQSELGALAKDVTLACQKHGVKDPSAAFLKDLITIFSSHGYKKEISTK